ncbi:hypothetical protein [Streptomyces sp. NPDC023838]
MAKNSAVSAKRQAGNQLKALLITADPAFRDELRSLSRRGLILACLQLPEGGEETDPVVRATRFMVRVLAERIEQLGVQARVVASGRRAGVGVGPNIFSGMAALRPEGVSPVRLVSDPVFGEVNITASAEELSSVAGVVA